MSIALGNVGEGMTAYSIFDDFGDEPSKIIKQAGIQLTVHPQGTSRPDKDELKVILEKYDCVILGTGQKITPDMFDRITTARIISTASVGVDHIELPDYKKSLVTIVNAPKANAQSVAEFTIGCALACCKRLAEGNTLYLEGKNNKALVRKPEDLNGRVMGVAGAGNISVRIMELALCFGMKVLCWTANPDRHRELTLMGIQFVPMEELAARADVISVNLPCVQETKGIISPELIGRMKNTAIFISVSRLQVIDLDSLLLKAGKNPNFYVCVDIDTDRTVTGKIHRAHNVLITPHIGGGTIETRKRMFKEVAENTVAAAKRLKRNRNTGYRFTEESLC